MVYEVMGSQKVKIRKGLKAREEPHRV